MKVVVDTNVVISFFLKSKSNPSSVFENILNGANELLLSDKLFSEYKEVLSRKKFSKIIKTESAELFIKALIRVATFINTSSLFTDCKDPKDNMLLDLAVDGKADCIITGDKLVLELHPFQGIPILNPSDFLDWIANTEF